MENIHKKVKQHEASHIPQKTIHKQATHIHRTSTMSSDIVLIYKLA